MRAVPRRQTARRGMPSVTNGGAGSGRTLSLAVTGSKQPGSRGGSLCGGRATVCGAVAAVDGPEWGGRNVPQELSGQATWPSPWPSRAMNLSTARRPTDYAGAQGSWHGCICGDDGLFLISMLTETGPVDADLFVQHMGIAMEQNVFNCKESGVRELPEVLHLARGPYQRSDSEGWTWGPIIGWRAFKHDCARELQGTPESGWRRSRQRRSACRMSQCWATWGGKHG